MKPTNNVYIGGPPLDPPDDELVIHCKFCKKKFPRSEWVRNHWHCPGCHEEDAAGITEEDLEMSNRVHLKPRIKLVDGAWEAIPPTAIHVPNLVELAEQFCAEKNMDLEVRCACGSEYGMPNADDGRFYCNRGHGGAFHCAS